jgi:hypothetical protein
MSEALGDAARWGATEAQHALGRDMDSIAAEEGEEEAAQLGRVEAELVEERAEVVTGSKDAVC